MFQLTCCLRYLSIPPGHLCILFP
ncbi:(2Fe-2S)-binding protein [Barnesiella intestinihominis]